MEKHTIEIIINEDGTVETETKGIKGSGCEAISKWLSKLGKVVTHKSTKEKYEKGKRVEKIYERN